MGGGVLAQVILDPSELCPGPGAVSSGVGDLDEAHAVLGGPGLVCV